MSAVEGQVVSGLVSERVILRKITGVNIKDLADLVEVLRLRVSVLNPDDGKKYYSVTNPLVGGVEQTGTWRGVSVKYTDGVHNAGRTDSPAGTIIQELRYGWATTLIDTEARLIGGDNIPLQPERFLQRQYVALDFTKLGTMIDEIETTKYVTDPVVETKEYSGKYRILSSKPSKADDGSGIITQTLAKNLVTTPDALPAAILLSDDKALLSPFAHDTTSAKNAYVWEYRWIDPDYAQTLRDTIALTAGVIDAKVVKVDDGTCSIQVLTQTNTWNGDLSQIWERRDNNPTFAANQIVNTFSHIPLTSLADFKTTLGTATAGYKVTSLVDNTDANGGFATIVQTQDKLFDGTVTADNGIDTGAEYLPLLTGGVFRTTMWLGVPDADLATAMTTLATPPSGYFIRNLVNNYNGTGSCTIVRTMGPEGPFDVTPQANQFPGFDDERRTYWHVGLNATQATAKYIELKTTCDAGYKVDSVELREYRWETVLVIQNISKLNLALTGTVNDTDYTKTFGLVNIATTLYLNVAHNSIAGLKASILADTTKLILTLRDDDVGQGKANLTCVWRSKESSVKELGRIKSVARSQFHLKRHERTWIDLNVSDAGDMATAVAAALAGSGSYAKGANETITEAEARDGGDKTAIITQQLLDKGGSYTAATYLAGESFNAHGLKPGGIYYDIMEYPEVAYDASSLATVAGALLSFLHSNSTSTVNDLGERYNDAYMRGKLQVSLNENGTLNARAVKEGKPSWYNITPDFTIDGKQLNGSVGESVSAVAPGVPIALASARVTSIAPEAGYLLSDARFIDKGNGEAEIHQTQSKEDKTCHLVHRTKATAGHERETVESVWPLVLNANLDAVWEEARTTYALGGILGDVKLDYRQCRLLSNGFWEVRNVVADTTRRSLSYTSEDSDSRTVTVEKGWDYTATPTCPSNGRLDLDINRFGKYDYVKMTITNRSPVSAGSGYSWTTTGRTYWRIKGYNTDGTVHEIGKYQKTYSHAVSFHATASAAAGAADGGYNGSHVVQVSDYIWMANKITENEGYVTSEYLGNAY